MNAAAGAACELLLVYFAAMFMAQLGQLAAGLPALWREMQRRALGSLPQFYSGLEPPVSVLLPLLPGGEAQRIRALLQFVYAEHEVVVIARGFDEAALDALVAEFDFIPSASELPKHVPMRAVRAVFRSTLNANLRLIDMAAATKAEALNAGVNASAFPIVAIVEADLIFRHGSLHLAIQPFCESPTTVASLSLIGVADGSELRDGFLLRVGLPRAPLAFLQVVERARMTMLVAGFALCNVNYALAEVFALLAKPAVIDAGGFAPNAAAPVRELVARMQRRRRHHRQSQRIATVAEPICWIAAPQGPGGVLRQHARWQRGWWSALTANLGLLMPDSRLSSWAALLLTIAIDLIAPFAEVAAWILIVYGWLSAGLTASPAWVLAGWMLIGSALITATSVVLEGITMHAYRKPRQVAVLLLGALAEQFGYRQWCALARLLGFVWRA